MPLFHRREPRRTPPEGFGPADIRTRSSICTGETTVGFYDPHTDKLLQAVVVRGFLPRLRLSAAGNALKQPPGPWPADQESPFSVCDFINFAAYFANIAHSWPKSGQNCAKIERPPLQRPVSVL